MSLHDCAQCLKLWQIYLTAKTEHADLRLKQQLAAASDDFAALERLKWDTKVVEGALKAVSQNIRDHTAMCHPNEAVA